MRVFLRWYDGFSTFYVGADGLIQKHIVDKVLCNLVYNNYNILNIS